MPLHIEPSPMQKADEAYRKAYYENLGDLNRQQRRTARGRQLVAEAHAKALQARIDVLEDALGGSNG